MTAPQPPTNTPIDTLDVNTKPDIKLVRALQADYKELYQKEFTTSYKEQRLIRDIELGIMRLKNTEKLISQEVQKARIEELEAVRNKGGHNLDEVCCELCDRLTALKKVGK